MPNPGQELATIDFESMIGGPLIAVINAQAQAAMTTVNFIKEVGFKKIAAGDLQSPENAETNQPIYVTFKYPKEVKPYEPAVAAVAAVAQVGDPNFPQGMQPLVPAGAPNDGNPAHAGGLPVYVAPVAAVAAKAAVPAEIMEMKLEVPILTMLPIPFIRIDLATIDFNAKINSVEYRKTDTSLKIDAATEGKAGWLWGSAKLKVSSSFQRNTSQGINVERTYSLAVHVKAVQDEIPAGMERILGILENAMREQPVSVPAPISK
jgi:hypothetical protein